MSALPTVMQVRQSCPGLTSRMVAEKAGVSLGTEYLMEIGGCVSRKDAEKVIAALSHFTGVAYSLQTLGGFILKENENNYLDKLRMKGNIPFGREK